MDILPRDRLSYLSDMLLWLSPLFFHYVNYVNHVKRQGVIIITYFSNYVLRVPIYYERLEIV